MAVSKINRPNDATVPAAPKTADKSFKDALKASKRGEKGLSDVEPQGVESLTPKAKKELEETRQPRPEEPTSVETTGPTAPQQTEGKAESNASVGREETQFGEAEAAPPSDEIRLGDDPPADPSLIGVGGPVSTDGQAPQVADVPATTAPPSTEVVQQLVTAMAAEGWVGTDMNGRKVVMLNVQCPGRGNVKIRLRQEQDGVSVRARADNDELAGLLQEHQGELKQAMDKKGMKLAQLEVVS